MNLDDVRRVMKSYVDANRSILLLTSNCTLDCMNCSDAVLVNCWITNVVRIANTQPDKIIPLVGSMSSKFLKFLCNKLQCGSANEIIAKLGSIKIEPAFDFKKPIVRVSHDLVLPSAVWDSPRFVCLSHIAKLILLEIYYRITDVPTICNRHGISIPVLNEVLDTLKNYLIISSWSIKDGVLNCVINDNWIKVDTGNNNQRKEKEDETGTRRKIQTDGGSPQ